MSAEDRRTADPRTGDPRTGDPRTGDPRTGDPRTAGPRVLAVPQTSLVVLVGASGAGKSSFARRHFGRYEVVSSDVCRGMVSDDENDQGATRTAFELLNQIVGHRLTAGLLTVVDATSVQRSARAELVELARAHDVLPVAIVLDVPEAVCTARNAARPDRDHGARVVHRQSEQLRRSLKGLAREGFRTVHVLRGVEEVDAASVVRERLVNDRRDDTGPFDVIGDVHGCREELEDLLAELGYGLVRDDAGRPVEAVHPAGRRALFLGDLVDRGPDSPGVLRLVMGMVGAGHALAVPGNHEHKLVRALDGRDVTLGHGLAETLDQLAAEDADFRARVREFCWGLVSHLVLDGGRLVVAHAGLVERYHGRASGRVRSFALYGDTTGEVDARGMPVRLPWAQDYRGEAVVLYGHTPVRSVQWVNRTACLDTGAVFGGQLSAMRWPEREVVSVAARAVHHAPPAPLGGPGHRADGARQESLPGDVMTAMSRNSPGPGVTDGLGDPERGTSDHGAVLDITDVLGLRGDGRRVVDTLHAGPVTVTAEQSAGALEVMSRFALPPELLLHLPPTMSPCATSSREGLLEHPEEAFEGYRADGVRHVVCEEKHMGSRAVVLLRRDGDHDADADSGADAGASAGARGAVHTRTGRPFFGADLTGQLLARLAAAAERAGLWEELSADWLLLDAELLPWSAKAEGLLREHFAPVGAAARAALPAAAAVLEAAAARGLDVGELLGRTRRRESDTAAFTDAYRRYVWPVEGLDGVRLAPFQLLASGRGEPVGQGAGGGTGGGTGSGGGHEWPGATHHHRDHLWHLALADRLVAAAPDLVAPTRRIVVDTEDPASRAAGTAWWEDLTAAGGEGAVVKPLAGLVVRRAPRSAGPAGSDGSPGSAATSAGRGGADGSTGRMVQPGVKVRGREYLRLVYGPEYTEPATLARLRQRSLGHKRSLALREHALGLESLERVARGEPLWRVHEAVFAVLALESEPVDPRL